MFSKLEVIANATDVWRSWEPQFTDILSSQPIALAHAALEKWDAAKEMVAGYEASSRPLMIPGAEESVSDARKLMGQCMFMQSFFKATAKSQSRTGLINAAIKRVVKDKSVPEKMLAVAYTATGARKKAPES